MQILAMAGNDDKKQGKTLNKERVIQPSTEDKRLWLERRLYNWAVWWRMSRNTEFHVRARSLGQGFTHYGETDYHMVDVKEAIQTNSAVHDLKRLEFDAIECEYLKCEWKHSVPVAPVLAVAHEAVRMALKRRGHEATILGTRR
jgi:hypothetical protein